MTFKQDYLQNKAANWKNHDRNLLAEREYKTISYLLKVFYNFELKKGSSILDLGSGDQFLRNEFSKNLANLFFHPIVEPRITFVYLLYPKIGTCSLS